MKQLRHPSKEGNMISKKLVGKAKTRHREYIDAIKHTKERLKVDMDYQPFLICRALWRDEEMVHHLNILNRKPMKALHTDTKEQRLFEKQMHFDYLLGVVEKTDPGCRATSTLSVPSNEKKGARRKRMRKDISLIVYPEIKSAPLSIQDIIGEPW
jgi:hypothetical protein